MRTKTVEHRLVPWDRLVKIVRLGGEETYPMRGLSPCVKEGDIVQRAGGYEYSYFTSPFTSPYRSPSLGPVYLYDSHLKVEYRELTQEEYAATFQPRLASGSYFTARMGINMSGTDPEIFLVDENEEVIPAWTFLGSKKKPHRDNVYTSNAYFWDGFQAEMTVSAVGCHQSLHSYIQRGLHSILHKAREVNPWARLSPKCVVNVKPSYLHEIDEKYSALGCSPSLNVYDEPQLALDDPKEIPFRFAGCHIHLSFQPKITPQDAENVVRGMDLFAGLTSVSLLAGLEDERRRRFYGKAGEYRLPPHGLEWRVLSSSMLCNSVTSYLMFDIARAGAAWGRSQYKDLHNIFNIKHGFDRVRHIINDLDVHDARKVLNENRDTYVSMFRRLYGMGAEGQGNAVFDLIISGAKNEMETTDMEKGWAFKSIGQLGPLSVAGFLSHKRSSR